MSKLTLTCKDYLMFSRYTLSKTSDPTEQKADNKLFRDVVTMISLSFTLGLFFDILRLPAFFGYVLAGTLLGPTCFDQVKASTLKNLQCKFL